MHGLQSSSGRSRQKTDSDKEETAGKKDVRRHNLSLERQYVLRGTSVREFDMTGRPMKGWLLLNSKGARKSSELKSWIKEAVGYAETLKKK
jgi:hypothetical protein